MDATHHEGLRRRRGELMKRQKKQMKEEGGKENMLGEDRKDTKELSVIDFPINPLHTARQVRYRSLHHHH